MNSFEYSGVWWLPSRPEHKVIGTVTFAENDRINLVLSGLLEPDRDLRLVRSLKQYPLILGLINDGRAITLFDCRETNLTISHGVDGKQQCLAFIAYLGTHFTDPQEVRFNKMDIHYSHLPQWAGVFPFLGHQRSFNAVRASTTKGAITVQSTPQLGNSWIEEAVLPEAVWMRVETPEKLSLDEWNTRFISPLQNLLSLATQRPNSLFGIRAYVKQRVAAQSNCDVSETPVQVIFPPPFLPIAPSRTVFPETVLFSLQDVASDFDNVMNSWLTATEELDSVCNLFFGVQYTKISIDQRFLFIAQAAETYQSRRFKKLYLSEKEYQRLLKVVLAGCPKGHRKWLMDKLQYSNRPTFRQQLKDLVNKTSQVLLPLIGKNRHDKDAFTDSVYDTRNYLTHYTKELEPKAARGDKLFFITQYLSLAVEVCLLYELGFTPEHCVEMVRKHELYGFLLGLQSYSS